MLLLTSVLSLARSSSLCSFPRGEVSLDDFSVLLAHQISLVKARRQRDRDERAAQRTREQYFDDRSEVVLEIKIARAASAGLNTDALTSELDELVTRNESRELVREKLSTADFDEAVADAHADNKFAPIDTYVFYRTTTPKSIGLSSGATGPPQRTKLMDVRDLFLGLANLIFDHADPAAQLSSRAGQKNIPASVDAMYQAWSARDVEVFTRMPHTKLHFAFRVTDEDRDGMITLHEAERMIGRLIRTGHVESDSLRQRRQTRDGHGEDEVIARADVDVDAAPSATSAAFLPYVYDQRTPAAIVREYWHEIAHQRRVAALAKREALTSASAGSSAVVAAAAAPLPSLVTPDFAPQTKISWDEFLAASRFFTDNRDAIAFWYLHSTFPTGQGTGSFYRWRHRRSSAMRHLSESVPTSRESRDIDRTVETFLV